MASDRVRDVTDKAQQPGVASDLSSVDILKEQPALQAQSIVLREFPQCTFEGLEFNTTSLLKGQPPDPRTLAVLEKTVKPFYRS